MFLLDVYDVDFTLGRSMSWLPQDWVSFLWGAVVAGVGILASGFFKKLGEDLYAWSKRKVVPDKPEPVRVEEIG
ncbi:MAG TPA: hypothetical protein VIO81_07425, partial [Methyloversatilis sp.]